MNINKHRFYMNIVDAIAEASHATRGKVGALLERDGNIIAFGYNGMPAGFDNECEVKNKDRGGEPLITKPEVLHAESNAIAKCARSTASSAGCILYCTYSPCFECSKLIVQAGIVKVIYKLDYRTREGMDLLFKVNIPVIKL